MNAKVVLVTAAASLLLATAASAQTLYKLIDRNGKVTYSESKPKEFDGQVIRLDIDPNANIATLPKPPAQAAGSAAARAAGAKTETIARLEGATQSPAEAARAAGVKNQAIVRLEGAQERLGRAKAALQDARDNPRESDFERIGKVGGGSRPVPTDLYLQRVSKLEDEVRQAEEAVARAEKGR